MCQRCDFMVTIWYYTAFQKLRYHLECNYQIQTCQHHKCQHLSVDVLYPNHSSKHCSIALAPAGKTVYPKKYAHGFCFAMLCCGYTLTDFPISTRLTSLALWQSNDCPSASKATLMNMDKYFMWIHYERLHNHNKAKHNKTMCIFLGIYCRSCSGSQVHFLPIFCRCLRLFPRDLGQSTEDGLQSLSE